MLGEDVLPRIEPRDAPGALLVEHMTRLAAAGAGAELSRLLEAAIRDSVAPRRVAGEHLTDTARRLGEWWEEDRCSFCEVSLGVMLLREQLARLGAMGVPAMPRRDGAAVFIGCAPREQHRFGAAMLAEGFRDAGWSVTEGDADDAAPLVSHLTLSLVAFSAGSRDRALALVPAIAALRAGCRRVPVLVGGPAFLLDPALVRRVGADGTASDLPSALRRAEALVGLPAEGA